MYKCSKECWHGDCYHPELHASSLHIHLTCGWNTKLLKFLTIIQSVTFTMNLVFLWILRVFRISTVNEDNCDVFPFMVVRPSYHWRSSGRKSSESCLYIWLMLCIFLYKSLVRNLPNLWVNSTRLHRGWISKNIK